VWCDGGVCNLKLLLGATRSNYLPEVLQKSSYFELQISATVSYLEAFIAESGNWKLSLAESSKDVISLVDFSTQAGLLFTR